MQYAFLSGWACASLEEYTRQISADVLRPCRRWQLMRGAPSPTPRAYSTNASLGLHMVTHTRALLIGGVPFTRRASRYQWQ